MGLRSSTASPFLVAHSYTNPSHSKVGRPSFGVFVSPRRTSASSGSARPKASRQPASAGLGRRVEEGGPARTDSGSPAPFLPATRVALRLLDARGLRAARASVLAELLPELLLELLERPSAGLRDHAPYKHRGRRTLCVKIRASRILEG